MVAPRLHPLLALVPLLALAACGARDACPNGPMTDGPEGLVVTPAEHPDAWGEDNCFACHDLAVLHRTGCTPGIDLAAVRAQVDEALSELGPDAVAPACAECHGAMGVTP